jgi:hypothetical protein
MRVEQVCTVDMYNTQAVVGKEGNLVGTHTFHLVAPSRCTVFAAGQRCYAGRKNTMAGCRFNTVAVHYPLLVTHKYIQC